jgi:hypothetical protein
LITYQEGQRVRHQLYGLGTIVTSDEERTAIDFGKHGTRKFVTSLVVLEPAPEVPHPKAAKRRPPRRRSRK